jgi:hypothetical protein
MTSRKQKLDLIRDRLKDEPIDMMMHTGHMISDRGIYHVTSKNCAVIKDHAIFYNIPKYRILNKMLYDWEIDSLLNLILAIDSPILYEIYGLERAKVKRL